MQCIKSRESYSCALQSLPSSGTVKCMHIFFCSRTASHGNMVCSGVDTVNVVRDRPGLQALTDDLMDLGATVVTTEDALKARLKEAGLAPPALALNCVGGSSGTAVAKSLECVAETCCTCSVNPCLAKSDTGGMCKHSHMPSQVHRAYRSARKRHCNFSSAMRLF